MSDPFNSGAEILCLTAGERPKTVFDIIRARRSVRSYMPGGLERSTIGTLLEAAVLAPTAMHGEPWAFVVVQDRQKLQRLSGHAKPLFLERLHLTQDAFPDPDFDLFHGAGTLIVICARISGPFVEADCWLAAENLMLAACAIGLGSCVIGSSVAALNLPELKVEFGIPDEFEAIAPIAVGVPAVDAPAASRKPPWVLAWL